MSKSSRAGRSGGSSNSKPPKKSIKNARSLLDVLGFGRKKSQSAVSEPEAEPKPLSGPVARRGFQLKTSYTARSGPVPIPPKGKAKDSPVRARDPKKQSRSDGRAGSMEAGERDTEAEAPRGSQRGTQRGSQRGSDRNSDRGSGRGGKDRQAAKGSARDSSKGAAKTASKNAAEGTTGATGGRTTPGQRGAAARAYPGREGASASALARPPAPPTSATGQAPAAAQAVVVSKGRGQGAPRLEGTIKRHPDGFGFLICDEKSHPDVYISRQYMTGIMTNDRVEAEIYQARDEDRFFGEITKVIKRSNSVVVGRYLPVDLLYGVVQDDGRGWGMDLRIAAEDSLGAKDGDLVAVEIKQYPMKDREFSGRVVSIIGDVEDPLNDVKRIIFSHHIPHEFSEKAKLEARAYGGRVQEEEARGRVDLRKKSLITIDGATARDFDDAVCVEPEPGGFRLWVAIADVSHYVKPGTELDLEAYQRGTSTYFPNFVVPMLPEELSNDLCSLNPKVPRLCFACEMKIGFQGVEGARHLRRGPGSARRPRPRSPTARGREHFPRGRPRQDPDGEALSRGLARPRDPGNPGRSR
jgi:hypothetical protein